MPRHYCKSCNCWVNDDPASIKRHETSRRHTSRLEFLQRKQRKERESSLRNEERLQRELARLETAALKSSGLGKKLGRTPQNPTTASSSGFATFSSDSAFDIGSSQNFDNDLIELHESDDEEDIDPTEVLGQYTMDKTLFLQGNWHEDLLVKGTICEVLILNKHLFGEDEEEWKCAEIGIETQSFSGFDIQEADVNPKRVKRKDKNGLVQNIVLREYKVKLKRPDGAVLVLPVEPRDIRLRAPLPPTVEPTEEEKKQIEIDEIQGSSDQGWSVVSVQVYQEEDEIHAGKQGQKSTKDEQESEDASIKHEIEKIKQEVGLDTIVRVKAEESDMKVKSEEEGENAKEVLHETNDAYATFNPYGGDYKGFKIKKNEDLRLEFDKGIVEFDLGAASKSKKAKFRTRKKK